MHILTLSTLFPHAAAPNFGVFVERQTQALARQPDVEVTVVNPVGVPPWPLSAHRSYAALAQLPRLEEWHGLTVHRPRFVLVPRFGGPYNPGLIARAVLPLVERIHREKPIDLIDAEFFYPDGPAAMRIAGKLGLPYSVKARGADIHHWGNGRATGDLVVQAGCNAAGLLAVSEALKADMATLGIPNEAIRVHYTGCDQTRFRPMEGAEWKTAQRIDGPLIVTTGALIPRKRQDLVISALPQLPGATLALAGAGAEEASYRSLAERIGVAERVRFLGSVPHDDLPRWLAAADVMALVSVSEGLANAWVEALACGTPIVISEAGGARELVRDPVAGRIVPPEPEAIAGAISAILDRPPSRDAVRATVARFTWDRNGRELAAYFREILDRDRA